MLDTLKVARSLTDADFTPAQADAITEAVREAADRGDYVTNAGLDERLAAQDALIKDRFAAQDALIKDRFAAQDALIKDRFAAQDPLIEDRFAAQDARQAAAIAALETRLAWRFTAALLAQAALIVALLRLLG